MLYLLRSEYPQSWMGLLGCYKLRQDKESLSQQRHNLSDPSLHIISEVSIQCDRKHWDRLSNQFICLTLCVPLTLASSPRTYSLLNSRGMKEMPYLNVHHSPYFPPHLYSFFYVTPISFPREEFFLTRLGSATSQPQKSYSASFSPGISTLSGSSLALHPASILLAQFLN